MPVGLSLAVSVLIFYMLSRCLSRFSAVPLSHPLGCLCNLISHHPSPIPHPPFPIPMQGTHGTGPSDIIVSACVFSGCIYYCPPSPVTCEQAFICTQNITRLILTSALDTYPYRRPIRIHRLTLIACICICVSSIFRREQWNSRSNSLCLYFACLESPLP